MASCDVNSTLFLARFLTTLFAAGSDDKYNSAVNLQQEARTNENRHDDYVNVYKIYEKKKNNR